jgi:hypothetical protein
VIERTLVHSGLCTDLIGANRMKPMEVKQVQSGFDDAIAGRQGSVYQRNR